MVQGSVGQLNVSRPGRLIFDPGFGDEIEVIDAATVLIVRDGTDGIEVLMMRRNLNSDFVGGAYVFPGGGVDESDHGGGLAERCAPIRTTWELVPRIAAVREVFEEAGLYLATVDGEFIAPDRSSASGTADWALLRDAVNARETTFAKVSEEIGGMFAVDQLMPLSRWVTPLGAPRRYDTRFYVVAAPTSQVASHDDIEVTTTSWIRPADALERHWAGEITLIFPTARSLVELSEWESIDSGLSGLDVASEPEGIVPAFRPVGDDYVLVLPDGSEYDAHTARPI